MDNKDYVCDVCGYVYSPNKGDSSQDILAGTPFNELPNSWECPVCGVDKTNFIPKA